MLQTKLKRYELVMYCTKGNLEIAWNTLSESNLILVEQTSKYVINKKDKPLGTGQQSLNVGRKHDLA